MQPGKISPVIKTSFGYHIFELMSRRPAGIKGFSEVIHKIETLLIRQKQEVVYKKWLEKLRSDFKVEVNQDMVDKMELS